VSGSASWRTLYELSRLDDDQIRRAFANGTIHPEMSREDVLGAVRPRRKLTPRERVRLEAARAPSDDVLNAQALIDLIVDPQVREIAIKLLFAERESDRAAVAAAVAELANLLRPDRLATMGGPRRGAR
jgi:hypothetical protein